MDKAKIDSVVDSAFNSAFSKWTSEIEQELYPSAFTDEYSWLCIKNAMKINNAFLKEALKQSLAELLED